MDKTGRQDLYHQLLTLNKLEYKNGFNKKFTGGFAVSCWITIRLGLVCLGLVWLGFVSRIFGFVCRAYKKMFKKMNFKICICIEFDI